MKIPANGHVEVVNPSYQCHNCRSLGSRLKRKERRGWQCTYGAVYKDEHGCRCQPIHEKCLDCGYESTCYIDYDCLASFFPA